MQKEELFFLIRSGGCCAIGFGVSNRPLVRMLLDRGLPVVVRDQKTPGELGEEAIEAERAGARFVTGKDYLKGITEKVIFRSPGLRPDLPEIAEAVGRGSILTSEMELFLSWTPATVLAVTGSDGKTTTTTLTGEMLKTECETRGKGRVYVGGNIGCPLLPLMDEMTKDDFAVLELSSFQLQTVTRSADYAAITNVTPNHLNWHTGMEEYTEAKTNIYRHSENKRLVTNAGNEITRGLAEKTRHPRTLFSSRAQSFEEIFPEPRPGDTALWVRDRRILRQTFGEPPETVMALSDILLPGTHNLENYLTAIGLCWDFVSTESIRRVAETFRGVKHRLELVAERDGIKYYNSSIDTSPTRTAAALSALTGKPIVIVGGYDKKIPLEPLADVLAKRAKAVVLTGATGERIRSLLEGEQPVKDGLLPLYADPDFDSAVRLACSIAGAGDSVLLSPGCASFDAFPNFEARGERFRTLVNEYLSHQKKQK